MGQKSNNQNAKSSRNSLISDFILGGLIIAVSGYFIRKSKTEVGGFIYGALPIGFVYIYLLTYYVQGLSACRVIAKEVIVASIFFVLFIAIVYYLNPYGPWIALIIALIVFLLACKLYFYGKNNKVFSKLTKQ